MTAKNLFINSQRTGRTPCLPNAMRIRGPNIQFWRIWSKISPQIVFQVADSTKAGPLAVSDCHLVLPHLFSIAVGRTKVYFSNF